MGDFASVVGHGTEAVGSIVTGNAKEAASKFEANQLRTAGNRVMASAITEAQNVDLKSKLLASRAVALAAAGGGSATDPSSVRIVADIKGEAAHRATQALYEGQTNKDLYDTKAAATIIEGKQARTASIVNAFGKASEATPGVMSLYDKYKPAVDINNVGYEDFSGGSTSKNEWDK